MTFDSRASQTPGLFKLGEEHVALHSQLATLTNPASLFALRNRASSVIGNVLPLRHRRNYGLAVGGYLFGSLALFCGRHGRDLGGIINAPCRRESTDHSATLVTTSLDSDVGRGAITVWANGSAVNPMWNIFGRCTGTGRGNESG